MKKLTLSTFAGLLILIGLAGCATPLTLTPAQPAQTNSVTGTITPAVPAVVTNLPNATVTEIVSTGNAIAPALPAPYGTALSAVLGLAALAAGYFAQAKNKQLNTAQAVTTAIVQGVESAGTAAAAVKQAVATVSKANGVADAVEAAVNKVTGSD